MKKYYHSPEAEAVFFETEGILSLSDGKNPILDSDENNTPNNPAEEFGDINIY